MILEFPLTKKMKNRLEKVNNKRFEPCSVWNSIFDDLYYRGKSQQIYSNEEIWSEGEV